MRGFTFDAKAALERARNRRDVPTLPTVPTQNPAEPGSVGRVGNVGTVRASYPDMTPDELALDVFEERAAIREFEGGLNRAEAERAAWFEACRAAGL